jgi:hypothetical protein
MSPGLARRFELLEASRRRAVALLGAHDRVALNRPPGAGRWSALQVLHHVIASESATLGYVRKKMLGGAALPSAGVAEPAQAPLALQAALVLPLRFRAPAARRRCRRHRPRRPPRALGGDGQRWRELLEEFPPALGPKQARHPFVGLMGLADTLAFLEAHLGIHVRQVELLVGELTSSESQVSSRLSGPFPSRRISPSLFCPSRLPAYPTALDKTVR